MFTIDIKIYELIVKNNRKTVLIRFFIYRRTVNVRPTTPPFSPTYQAAGLPNFG
jgi:hypothetical protein